MKRLREREQFFTKGTNGNGIAQFLFSFIGITVARNSLQNIAAKILLGVIPHQTRMSITPLSNTALQNANINITIEKNTE